MVWWEMASASPAGMVSELVARVPDALRDAEADTELATLQRAAATQGGVDAVDEEALESDGDEADEPPPIGHVSPPPEGGRAGRTPERFDFGRAGNQRKLDLVEELIGVVREMGRTLSAVTLDNGKALTGNYLNVELAAPRPANQLVDLRIGEMTAAGLSEAGAFTVLAS